MPAESVSEPLPQNVNDLRLGTDLVFVPRLAEALKRSGAPFFARLLTAEELAYCRGSSGEKNFLKRAAARIAVKEAVAKALGVGLNGLGWGQGIAWHDVEVLSSHQRPPELRLLGRALAISGALGIRSWRLSLSHDGDYATATVIGLIGPAD